MTHPDDALFRAIEFLRSAPEPGWDAISDRVIAGVRATHRTTGWPLRAEAPSDQPGSGTIFISDDVLRSTLAVALRQRYLCAPTRIEFDMTADTLQAVHIQITGSYGTSLPDLVAAIRATTRQIIAEVLGPASLDERGPIDITVSDVVTGDPLQA